MDRNKKYLRSIQTNSFYMFGEHIYQLLSDRMVAHPQYKENILLYINLFKNIIFKCEIIGVLADDNTYKFYMKPIIFKEELLEILKKHNVKRISHNCKVHLNLNLKQELKFFKNCTLCVDKDNENLLAKSFVNLYIDARNYNQKIIKYI